MLELPVIRKGEGFNDPLRNEGLGFLSRVGFYHESKLGFNHLLFPETLRDWANTEN